MKKHNPPIPWFVDTTLRDGLQTPGVFLDTESKLKILDYLEQIGLQESELGIPAMGIEERSEQKKLIKANHALRKTGWCRARKEDVIWGLECGYQSLHVSIPVSLILLQSFGRGENWIYDQLEECCQLAKPNVKYFSVGLQDASRASREVLTKAVHFCRKFGVNRVRLADTVGVWTPAEVFDVFSRLKQESGEVALGFHGHNDLGMAVANTFTAWSAGAKDLDVTVNGLGERAGNAAMEEVLTVFWLKGYLAGFPFHLEKLGEVCRQISDMLRMPIPPHKPVTGAEIFTHESGIHVEALLKDKMTYEPFDPLIVGHEQRRVVYGTHSGTHSVEQVFQEAGIAGSPERVSTFLAKIKKISGKFRKCFEKKELLQWIYRNETDMT